MSVYLNINEINADTSKQLHRLSIKKWTLQIAKCPLEKIPNK